jgi:hypothetical protein
MNSWFQVVAETQTKKRSSTKRKESLPKVARIISKIEHLSFFLLMQKKNKRAWSAHNKPLSLKHSIGNKHDRNQEEGRTQESRHQGRKRSLNLRSWRSPT